MLWPGTNDCAVVADAANQGRIVSCTRGEFPDSIDKPRFSHREGLHGGRFSEHQTGGKFLAKGPAACGRVGFTGKLTEQGSSLWRTLNGASYGVERNGRKVARCVAGLLADPHQSLQKRGRARQSQ